MNESSSRHEQMAETCIAGAMLSHPGLVREHNEDSVVYRVPRPDDPSSRLGAFALVADGMGGHAAGEVASSIAARITHFIYYQQDRPAPVALAEAFFAANKVIHQRSLADPECAGMGTTCTVVVVRDDCAWLGHVGDSRAYLVRNGEIHQMSEDHSLVASLVRDGAMTPEEAATSPERNVILRALGTQATVEPQIWDEGLPLRLGDVLVLCSDGLSDLIDDATIAATVSQYPPSEACQALVDAALAAGGHDNVSVGIFAITAEPPQASAEDRPTRTTDVRALLGEQS